MSYLQKLSLLIVLISISACSAPKGNRDDIKVTDVFSSKNLEENLGITDMPEGYNYDDNPAKPTRLDYAVNSNNDVELYDPNNGVRAGAMQDNSMTMPSYSGGVNAANSSVTIYPLNQQMQNTFQGQAPIYNNTGATINQNFMPQSYNPAITSGIGFGSVADTEIYFRHGSSRLGSGDLKKISSVSQNTGRNFTVEGYASKSTQIGSDGVQASILNLKESMNRSFAVSRSLLKKGVPAENIKTVSYGSGKATGNPSQDRRVDITTGY